METTHKKYSNTSEIPATHYSRYLLDNHVMHCEVVYDVVNIPLNFICWYFILNALIVNMWSYSKCQNATQRRYSQLKIIYIFMYIPNKTKYKNVSIRLSCSSQHSLINTMCHLQKKWILSEWISNRIFKYLYKISRLITYLIAYYQPHTKYGENCLLKVYFNLKTKYTKRSKHDI